VRVHDRADVRALAVRDKVHQGFRRGFPARRGIDNAAVQIGDHHHVGGHEALRDTGRRHEQAIRPQPDADVAVVGRDKSAQP